MNKASSLWLTLALLVGLVVGGCRQENPMPGTWKLYVAPGGSSASVSGSAEFRSDMSCKMQTNFEKASWHFNGSYSVRGSELKIEGEVSENIPGGFDEKAQVRIEPVHRKERLMATGTISEDGKSIRIHGKNFIKQ